MRNWHTLDADENRLMNKHYTPGRGGHSVGLVVIHHNAGVLSIADIWNVWQDRAASAHYQVESGGRIGQLVWDRDTAWHAANTDINARSIGIEVSNSGGVAQDWPITDTAVAEAGKLAAAVCHAHDLGEPLAGRNVRFHQEFAATTCPYHLTPGGRYHDRLMATARDHYRWMSDPQEEDEMTPEQDRIQREIWEQLRGPDGEGWPQLGTTADGHALTLVDAVAAIRADLDQLRDEEQ